MERAMSMRVRFGVAVAIAYVACVSPSLGDEIVDGRVGPGALYRLVHPTDWNGRLVLYAHGFVSDEEPVALPPEADQLAVLFASQGFALAYSSFSENGWAVKDGAQRTHQLLGLYASKFGPPTGVYIAGASMGGLIAIELAERFPSKFIGVLPACAIAGGTRAQYDYLANTRAVFDVFYPGVLPGDAGDVPDDVNIDTDIIVPAIEAITNDATGAAVLAALAQTPAPFATADELGESIVTALVGHAGSFSDLVAKLHGKAYFDNVDTLYTGALPPLVLAIINATVGRFDAAPSALNFMAKYYQPTGRISVPMLMLSTSRDPVAPGFHQALYSQLTSDAGASALLFQRTVDRYGHCVFTQGELAAAFADLVAWVEFGVPPTP